MSQRTQLCGKRVIGVGSNSGATAERSILSEKRCRMKDRICAVREHKRRYGEKCDANVNKRWTGALAGVGVWMLAAIAESVAAVPSLEELAAGVKIDAKQFSVACTSSGGFMAPQVHVAHSEHIMGAASWRAAPAKAGGRWALT